MRPARKPPELFDRDVEWADLVSFAQSPSPGLRIGVIHGRRRQGKSFLLRRLCEMTGGLYTMALEQERHPALRRFADALAGALGLPPGTLRFDSWEDTLDTAVDLLSRQAAPGTVPLVVLDELPYLTAHSPELPSVLQDLYDRRGPSTGTPAVRLLLCGSAISVMAELLSGTRALRGRATVDLCLQPFDYRQAARFWGISDPETAFRIHAVLGGTPGYKDLIDAPPPPHPEDFGDWLARCLLNPSHALFNEADYLLREDPRVRDRALYHSLLAAIAGGASAPKQVGSAVGRDARSLAHPLDVLKTAGFIRHDEDILLQRRPVITVADPIVRFHHLITLPRLAAFEERRTAAAWAAAQPTFSSQILGPHFELLAREWTARFAPAELLGHPQLPGYSLGPVGTTEVNCRVHQRQHQVDVVALADGDVPRSRRVRIVLMGEAKSTNLQRDLGDLKRLEHIRGLFQDRSGVDAAGAHLVVFSRTGFTPELAAMATSRPDVHLVDINRIYGA